MVAKDSTVSVSLGTENDNVDEWTAASQKESGSMLSMGCESDADELRLKLDTKGSGASGFVGKGAEM